MTRKAIDERPLFARVLTMNLSKLPLVIVSVAAVLTFHASALDYVTLSDASTTVNLSAGDVAKIVGYSNNYSSASLIGHLAASRAQLDVAFALGNTITGLISLVFNNNTDARNWVTLEITRANEINAVQPSSVLVIPESATGDFNILVETSEDLNNWNLFHSQAVSSTDPKRFFRMRLLRRD